MFTQHDPLRTCAVGPKGGRHPRVGQKREVLEVDRRPLSQAAAETPAHRCRPLRPVSVITRGPSPAGLCLQLQVPAGLTVNFERLMGKTSASCFQKFFFFFF